jgi:CHAT domain-containing protein
MRSDILRGLQMHQFAHFMCHGTLGQENPFNASLKLYGGNHLELLDIVWSQLPAVEFVFLFTCHTAELAEGSFPGVGLHLTAAVQHCRFQSIVSIMWAMANKDGALVAEYFYGSNFLSDGTTLPYYEISKGNLGC